MKRMLSSSKLFAPLVVALVAVVSGCPGRSNTGPPPPPPNEGPTASITAPADGSSVMEGTSVSFEGSATDPEDGTLSGGALVWTSNRDGEIGTGASFSTSTLTAGSHTVTLTATDGDGATGTASVGVMVEANQSPTASITSPTDGGSAQPGSPVQFSGSGSDPEDGPLTGASLQWSSNLDGPIGSGGSFSSTTLSVGTHAITLTATDAHGATGTAGIDFTIDPAAGDNPPSITIDAPTPGGVGQPAAFGSGANVGFQATATDPEDGTLTGASIVWTSNVDGQIGTGESFSTVLSDGMHTVTATATDSNARTDMAVVLVNVTPADNPGGYDLIVRLSEGVTLNAAQQAAVANARARWEAIITGDLPSLPFTWTSAFTCGGADVPPFSETVDDVIIYLAFEPIDGPAGVLGSAGPCVTRDFGTPGTAQPGDLPLLGGMRFDTADLALIEALGLLEVVIVHEMGHVLGFGPDWFEMGYLQSPSLGSSCGSEPDTHFTGPEAIAAMMALETASGTPYTGGARVPIENDRCQFGQGSVDGHWRESVFNNELMTTQVGIGANPLSILTIESMEDIGYAVDPGQADAYNPTFSIVLQGQAANQVVLLNDIDDGPVMLVSPRGQITRIR